MRHFKGPTLGSISQADAARYRRLHLRYRDGLLTLAFGGVMDDTTVNGPTPEATIISTTRFADDLRMLVAAGYHTVSPAQVAAWHAGRAALPANAAAADVRRRTHGHDAERSADRAPPAPARRPSS